MLNFFYSFLHLIERINNFPLKNKIDKNKDNFQIIIKPRNNDYDINC